MKAIPRILINSCYDCPYCRYNPISNGYNCTNEKMPDDKMAFIISDKKLVETKETWPDIPSWCPLEDTKKTQKEEKTEEIEKKVAIPNKKIPCQFKTINPGGNLCSRIYYRSLCSLNKNCEFK
ncbi:hypothetical protein LCGC14_1315950 [marine sediment metagenome]|uniref:Uncharacterized protein n=1 Tax=marine sediment metagenome TaxID=412755 RepID=A0A0F9NND8_9ZZZZ